MAIGDLVTDHNQNAEFKSGGNQVERIPFGGNKWTHRFVFFGKVGKIGGTDLKEFQKGLFLEKLNNLVEKWGSSYAGRFLSYVGSQTTGFAFLKFII